MRKRFRRTFMTALILVGAACICLLLWMEIRCKICKGVYILSFQQEDRSFSLDNLRDIQREGIDATYVQTVRPQVSNGFRREEAEVYLTNENYAYIANINMQKGAFFNEIQVKKGLAVAVINEEAALRLFGNRDCVGAAVYLDDTPYQIMGIMEGQESESAKVYVPYSTMERLGITELKAGQIWCRFSNLAETARVMKKTGCSLEELTVIQMDYVKYVFWQRFALPLFLTGLYAVFCMHRAEKGKLKRMLQNKTTVKREMFGVVLCGLGVCMGILLLWILAASWCVPPACQLPGGDWKKTAYGILDFYLLMDVKIDNMPFLTHWNALSLLSMTVYLYLFSLCCVRGK